MNSIKKYLRIVNWARIRYTDKNGVLIISQGRLIDGKAGQVPSLYKRIEDAAWAKYMRGTRDETGHLVFEACGQQ